MQHLLLIAFVTLLTLPSIALAQGQPFVPLTSLPGLDKAGNESNMTEFLNQLYRLCIGAAAAIAVLQIVRAGILFMTNKGSVSENEQAKELVRGAVLGLILVLSPVIVFGIINPKILTLDFGASALQQTSPATGDLGSSDTPTNNDTCSPIAEGTVLTTDAQKACCAQQDGFAVSTDNPSKCVKKPNPNAEKWGWVGRFYDKPTCQSSGCPEVTLTGGPFDSQQQCFSSAGSDPAQGGHGALREPPGFTCNCDSKLGAQGTACQTVK